MLGCSSLLPSPHTILLFPISWRGFFPPPFFSGFRTLAFRHVALQGDKQEREAINHFDSSKYFRRANQFHSQLYLGKGCVLILEWKSAKLQFSQAQEGCSKKEVGLQNQSPPYTTCWILVSTRDTFPDPHEYQNLQYDHLQVSPILPLNMTRNVLL